MRDIILRVGLLVALAGTASGAQAATAAAATSRTPLVSERIESPSLGSAVTVEWIAETLQCGLSATSPVEVRTEASESAQINRMRSAKPHQNPAFPAAFVFQSNSASYLAADVSTRNERHSDSGT